MEKIDISKIYILGEAPSNAIHNRFWFDTSTKILKRYNESTTSWENINVSSDDVKIVVNNEEQTLTSYLSSTITTIGTALDSLENTKANTDDLPTKVSDLTNDSGYQTSSQVNSTVSSALTSYSTTSAINTLLADKAEDDEVVKLTGNQTAAGVKTFTSSPIVPTPTTDTQATNKTYVDEALDLKQDILTTGNTYSTTLKASSNTSADYTSINLQVYDYNNTDTAISGEVCNVKIVKYNGNYIWDLSTTSSSKDLDTIPFYTYDSDGMITSTICDIKIIKYDTGIYSLTTETSSESSGNTSLIFNVYDTDGSLISGEYCDITTIINGAYIYISNGNVISIQGLATIASTGDYNDLINKPDLTAYATVSELNNKATSKTSVSNTTSTTISVAIEGNKTYKYGTLNSLTFSTVEDSLYESVIFFTASSSFTTFTYPSTLYKIVEEITIEASKSYVVVISNNIMVVSELY